MLLVCQARKAAMRASELKNINYVDNDYVKWSYFLSNFAACCQTDNMWQFEYTFPPLTAQGVDIMMQSSASPSRFPIKSVDDWAGKWELWQTYYVQAFYLARRFGVKQWSLWNEVRKRELH